jgi:hypothetical protein
MSEQEFTGHVTAMRADAEFIGAEDIMGRGDVPMQIARVVQYTNRKACGKSQPTMFTLHFHNEPKELWIKATNRKQITKLYGPDASKWKDRWIWLHVEECKSPQGGMTLGVRIRDRTDAPKQAERINTKELWARLVAVCGTEAVAKETLSDKFGLSTFAGLGPDKAKEIDDYCRAFQGEPK